MRACYSLRIADLTGYVHCGQNKGPGLGSTNLKSTRLTSCYSQELMPPKNRRQAANLKERRHESGLARPGNVKQAKKQKSNGHLNGHLPSTPSSSNAPSGATVALRHSEPSDADAVDLDEANSLLYPTSHSNSGASINTPNGKDLGYPFSTGMSGKERVVNWSLDSPLRSSHDKANAFDKLDYANASGGGVVEQNTTVIWPCSVRDVVAILLLLLQLHHYILTPLHFGFAILTFGSASSGWSVSSIASTPEWIQGQGGNPSPLTTVITDLIALIIWPMLPSALSDFTLDLSQAVVAISLSGGATGRGGRTQTVICTFIIMIYHLMRHKSYRQYGATLLWSFISWLDFEYFDIISYLPEVNVVLSPTRSWPRALVELHILTQGIVRIVRRALGPSSSNPAPRKADTDHSIGSSNQATLPVPSPMTESERSLSSDGRHPGPSPSWKDGRDFWAFGSKKRRKQATFVRSQQPLWAAAAITKVTMHKEWEQNVALRDATEAGANNTRQLGSALENCYDERVWVKEIGESEVLFGTTEPRHQSPCYRKGSDQIDEANFPFQGMCIRVNGANWSSISFGKPMEDGDQAITYGKIHGLTPSTKYMIEFVTAQDNTLIQTINLLTLPIASLMDGESARTSPLAQSVNANRRVAPSKSMQPPQALRPLSPTTTLKNSVASLEAQLQEHRNRSKKSRKDHKNASNALKKEVENLEGKIASSGGNDDRQRQRQLQHSQNIQKAEESCSEMAAEIEAMGDIPQHEKDAAEQSKKAWEDQHRSKSTLRQMLEDLKADGERNIQSATSENANTKQRRERVTARLNKLKAQRESLVSASAQTSKTHERQEHNRNAIVSTRQEQERQILSQIQRFQGGFEKLTMDIQKYAEWLKLNDQLNPSHLPSGKFGLVGSTIGTMGSIPHAPETSFAGLATNTRFPTTSSGFGSNAIPPASQHHLMSNTAAPLHPSRRSSVTTSRNPRARSSSLLSNMSGITDDTERDSIAMPNTSANTYVGSKTSSAFPNNPTIASMNGARPSSLTFLNGTSTPLLPEDMGGYGQSRHVSGESTGSAGGFAHQHHKSGSGSAAGRDSPAPKLSPIGSGRGKDSPRGGYAGYAAQSHGNQHQQQYTQFPQ
ncbi:MAG: hypothetical protein M1831_006441 [Alyxoria varia]|nr:MAG: hypothetical protein M1831_006441 [Alyxoria varia]